MIGAERMLAFPSIPKDTPPEVFLKYYDEITNDSLMYLPIFIVSYKIFAILLLC